MFKTVIKHFRKVSPRKQNELKLMLSRFVLMSQLFFTTRFMVVSGKIIPSLYIDQRNHEIELEIKVENECVHKYIMLYYSSGFKVDEETNSVIHFMDAFSGNPLDWFVPFGVSYKYFIFEPFQQKSSNKFSTTVIGHNFIFIDTSNNSIQINQVCHYHYYVFQN